MIEIRVLHVTEGSLNGGAARGALWLHECCLLEGIDSILVVDTSSSVSGVAISKFHKGVLGVLSKSFRRYYASLIKLLYKKRKKVAFSFNYGGVSVNQLIEKFNPDVVNLHWINNGFINLGSLASSKVKIVYTLRDFWPVTGGCHYPLACNKFLSLCDNCPQYGRPILNYMDWVPKNHNEKMQVLSGHGNVTLVAMNRQLLLELRDSVGFGKCNIEYIPNGIPSDRFKRHIKCLSREKLRIQNNSKPILLIGANKLDSAYKAQGSFINYVIQERLHEKYLFLILGSGHIPSLDIYKKNFIFIKDVVRPEDLSFVYSAADIYIHTAKQEMFGKMVAESISCGTPVVGFRQYGLSDLVKTPRQGALVDVGDYSSMFEAIDLILLSSDKEIVLPSEFDISNVATKYIELYKKLVNA